MGDHLRRVVDIELDDLLHGLPAISLEGPKGVGKTVTALRRENTVRRFDDPVELAALPAIPRRIVEGPPPVLIDEWQRYPSSWDLVRRAVDDGRGGGRFLLTGSMPPVELPMHSGAGRAEDATGDRPRSAPTPDPCPGPGRAVGTADRAPRSSGTTSATRSVGSSNSPTARRPTATAPGWSTSTRS